MERMFNILRGVVVASWLDRDTKKEVLDFLRKLEEEIEKEK